MSDYESQTHTAYLTGTFIPSERVRFTGSLSISTATGALDQVLMPDVSSRLLNESGQPDLTHQDFTFPEMHTYSDLDYQLVKLSLGAQLRVAPSVTVTADGDYADLNDDTGYVYGNESGSYFFVRTGIRFDF
ncbi:MAG: hypothetical protein AB1644_05995 [Candidatus Zixiibacteriota bacterium]